MKLPGASTTTARSKSWLCVTLLSLAFGACQDRTDDSAGSVAQPVVLKGSGASFPAALYRKWIQEFNREYPSITIEYESKGSGGGIDDFIAGRTDFGASDAAMTDEHLIAQGNHALMLPATAGAIVIAYNLPNVARLRLSRFVYSGIFLGKITEWHDASIADLNPDVKLPRLPIQVVHRSDPSGTTWVFLNHLDKVNPWNEGLGVDLEAAWPVGIGADGNSGVAAEVAATPGAIGYMQVNSARDHRLSVASLENREGAYVDPTIAASQATLSAVGLPDDMRAWMPDPVGQASYPIVTYTWLMVDTEYEPPKAAALKSFLHFALDTGQEHSEALQYIRLPKEIATRVRSAVDTISDARQ